MSQYIVQQVINGLTLGSLYALVAIGFSMIYGIVRLINFAHGDIVMVGAFSTFGMIALGVPWPVIIFFVLVIGALTGSVIEFSVFRPMRGAPQVTGFIATLAVSVAIQNVGIMLLGSQPRNFTFPDFMRERIAIGPATVSLTDLLIVALTVVILIVLGLVVYRSKLGVAMRATSDNLMAARLMGININHTTMTVFAIGSSLAAIAGLMWGGKYGQIDPLFGFIPGLKAFVATVIGGVGSIAGAILGGYILGMAEVLFVGLLPPEFSGFRDAFVFSLLIVILLIRPNGLLGRRDIEHA